MAAVGMVLSIASTQKASSTADDRRPGDPALRTWSPGSQLRKEVFGVTMGVPTGPSLSVSVGGYKGYGLAMMVDLFCGVLSGAHYGNNIRSWLNVTDPADLGQCFVAINPEAFAPNFEDRMQGLMDMARSQEPAQKNAPVQVPGDPERQHMAKCDADGGIRYHVNQIKFADDVAANLGVDPPKRKQ